MRISRLETIPLQIPLRTPFKSTKAEQKIARVVVIKLHTDTGITGIGECDPRPHITGETVDSVLSTIRGYITPALTGTELVEVADIAKICARMDQVLVANPSAKAGIDIAAHDALGKAKGIPAYALLGPKQRNEVTSCGFSDLGTVAEAQEEARKALALGCNVFKIKVGPDWASDIKRIETVRAILRSDVDLIVDPNQAWSVEQSIKILKESGRQFAVCEQPISWDDMEGLAKVAEAVDVAVMADEAVWSPSNAYILARLKAAEMVNIKHLKSGGLYHAFEIAQILLNEGIGCMIGSTMETGISSAASAHLAVACPDLKYFDVAPPTTFLTEDITEGLTWKGYSPEPNNLPGLGLTLREDSIAKYRGS